MLLTFHQAVSAKIDDHIALSKQTSKWWRWIRVTVQDCTTIRVRGRAAGIKSSERDIVPLDEGRAHVASTRAGTGVDADWEMMSHDSNLALFGS